MKQISIVYIFCSIMHDIVLFGHSFINHLESYIDKDVSRNNLGLDISQYNVRFKGLSGLSFEKRKRLRREERVVRGASIVFLDIGTNDLANASYDPIKFARDLCSYAEYLREGFDVGRIIIGQILFRDVLPYDEFNAHVVKANDEIARLVVDLPNIYFWHHRGFWNPSIPVLDHTGRFPGVHLNEEGNRKYLRSIRDAIIRVSRW